MPKHPLFINILISVHPFVIPFMTLIDSKWDKMNFENNSKLITFKTSETIKITPLFPS